MKFLSLFSNISLKISQLMGISTPASLFGVAGSNQIESPNNFFENIVIVIKSVFEKLISGAFEIIVKVVYVIAKWMLVAVDFIFVLIRQMIGLKTDFSDVESITNSDLIFKFIFNERVVGVIKSMIGFGLILLILFSIFAIVKTEYNFVSRGVGNSKKQILSSALKSLFFMALVPILFIGGMILSNSIAQAFLRAVSGGTNTSLSSQIFVASTYDANRFRDYANNNLKIPITFNFPKADRKTDNISGWGTDGNIAELDQALLDFKNSNRWNRGYTTFKMFKYGTFIDMESVDTLQWGEDGSQVQTECSYNYTYDKNIYTNRDQYYVMADFIDYAVRKEQKFYYKTIEQVYESYMALYKALPEDAKDELPELSTDIIGTTTDGDYYVNVKYKSLQNESEIIHKKGALDESDGAVFIIAREILIEKDGIVYSTYYPVLSSQTFAQYNQDKGQCVVARGLFSTDGYPTAIRQVDGNIKFYRDELNIPTLIEFFPTISYEKPENATNAIPGLEAIKKGMSGLVGIDVTEFIPYVYFSFDIWNMYSKETYTMCELEDGYLRLDYSFNQDGYAIANVYNLTHINVVVLLFATVIILGMLLKIILGLAHRIMDVVLLAITYPAVVSTYPIDNGSRFRSWTDLMIKKITSIYGVVIGVNVVLLLFPIIDGLDLFGYTQLEHAILNGFLSTNLGVGLLNYITELLFMLVALTVIQSAPKIIESLSIGSEKVDSGILNDGENTVKDLTALPNTVGNIVTGKFVFDVGKKASSFIPGGAVINRIGEKIQDINADSQDMNKYKEASKKAINDQKLKGKPSDESVKELKDSTSDVSLSEVKERKPPKFKDE